MTSVLTQAAVVCARPLYTTRVIKLDLLTVCVLLMTLGVFLLYYPTNNMACCVYKDLCFSNGDEILVFY